MPDVLLLNVGTSFVMAASHFIPKVTSISNTRLEDLESKYGPIEVLDATSFVMGVTDHLPESMPCGCRLGRIIRSRLERARVDYLESEKQGRHLFASLGRLTTSDDGPLTIVKFVNGCIVVVIPSLVAETNPTMTVRNGEVVITGSSGVPLSLQKPGKSKNPIVRTAESAFERRSSFRLVETVSGGTSINMNSLHSNEYMVVHLQSMCGMWKERCADVGVHRTRGVCTSGERDLHQFHRRRSASRRGRGTDDVSPPRATRG